MRNGFIFSKRGIFLCFNCIFVVRKTFWINFEDKYFESLIII